MITISYPRRQRVSPALSPRPGVRPIAASAKMGCPAGAQGASRLLPAPELSQPRGNSDSKFSIRFCPWSALQPSRITLLQATTQCESPFLFCAVYFFLRLQLTSVTQPCPPLYNPWTTPCQASLSFTNSWSLLKLMSIKSVSPPISSSAAPFSSCLQSFPASGSSPMSQFFPSGGQSIGASASVLPMNTQD